MVLDLREREREIYFVVLPIHAFIDCFLYVSWLGIEPAIFAYQDNTLTKLPGQGHMFDFSKRIYAALGDGSENTAVGKEAD